MQSNPSNTRTAAAVVLYLVAGLGALACKMIRGGITENDLVPVWIFGVMPNFLPAGFLPMLLFITRRVLRAADFFSLVGAMLLALCAYEFAQIWMPKRTFDWADIAASVAGSSFGCLAGWLVFFRWLGSSTTRREFNKERDSDIVA